LTSFGAALGALDAGLVVQTNVEMIGLISERAIRKTPVFEPVDLSAFYVFARKLAEGEGNRTV